MISTTRLLERLQGDGEPGDDEEYVDTGETAVHETDYGELEEVVVVDAVVSTIAHV
jgi:hypothetical protein